MKKINWKYALGEILIVILGITIAFSLNKCAVQKDNDALGTMYLDNLTSDLQQDKHILEANLEQFKTKRNKINNITAILGSEVVLNGQHNALVFEVSELETFKSNNVTYNTLVNSGDFKLIKDFELRKAIEAHYNNTYNTIQSEYLRLENIHKVYLADLYIYKTDYDKFKTNEFVFEDKKLLYNILVSKEGASKIAMEASKKGIESCDQLLKRIQAYKK
ncbi:hypothetical protein [Paucihalobacter sp.]|uniref:hypothetical protein n=1 Tax=Paucihalobacter sp. TaxID=2850405 RepID=UPI002FE0B8F4